MTQKINEETDTIGAVAGSGFCGYVEQTSGYSEDMTPIILPENTMVQDIVGYNQCYVTVLVTSEGAFLNQTVFIPIGTRFTATGCS